MSFIKKYVIVTLRQIKRLIPLKMLYYLQPIHEVLYKYLYGTQIEMILDHDTPLEPMILPDGFEIKTFGQLSDKKSWLKTVDGILGEWDEKKADVFFFGDRAFDADLCLLLMKDGVAVGTASGRLLKRSGKLFGEVHMVSVLPVCRGLGLGNQITLAVLHGLRTKYPGSDIILKTDSWRIPAINTYKKIGFTITEC